MNSKAMVIPLNKDTTPKQVEERTQNIPPKKTLRTEKYLGKVNWGEDALEYQKRQRNEWE